MRQWGAVQPAPGQDAILLLQLERHLGVILPQKVHRNDPDPPPGISRPRHTDVLIPPQPRQEPVGQRHFPLVQGVRPHLQQVAQRHPQPHDARQVGRARLVAVGQGRGHLQRGRHTAGAARNQRCQRLVHRLVHHKPANAGGPQQPLMPGKAQGVNSELLHIKGKMPGRLRAVHRKQHPVPAADGPDLPNGLNGPADVTGVLHHHQPGFGGEQPLEFLQPQHTVLITRGDGHLDPGRLQLHGRACHRIVLHPADDQMIAGTQHPFHDHIQAQCDPAGKNGIARVIARTEQPAQVLPHGQGGKRRFGRSAVAGTVDVDPHLLDIILHGLPDARRLGEASRPIIQIDLFHMLLRSPPAGI